MCLIVYSQNKLMFIYTKININAHIYRYIPHEKCYTTHFFSKVLHSINFHFAYKIVVLFNSLLPRFYSDYLLDLVKMRYITPIHT